MSLKRTMNPCGPFQLEIFTQGGHSPKELEFLQFLWVSPIQQAHKRKARKALLPHN